MTDTSKQSFSFSQFMNSAGISPEWQNISSDFTSLMQKTMTENLQNFGNPSQIEKNKSLTKDWQKLWEDITHETQKTATKNMNNFGPSDPTSTATNSPTEEWENFWNNMIQETQKNFTPNMKPFNFNIPSFTNMGNAVFNPDVMVKTLTKAFTKMGKKPKKFEELRQQYLKDFQALLQSTMDNLQGKITKSILEPESNDKRFQDRAWNDNPFFSLLQQAYLLNAKFLKEVVNSIEDLDPITRGKLMFYTSHLCDALSPTNYPLTNPTVLQETLSSAGKNLAKGFQNYIEDFKKNQWHSSITDMNAFQLGKTLATTPGKVVFQNDLFQLIQYDPLTTRVAKTPLLIIPPWINKYYIFDLKPENSFVRWALESGLSVFIISWVNPDERHAEKTLTDYTLSGVKTAIDQVCEITGEKKVNTIGYCNGGSLLSLLMVYLKKKKKENPIASATLLVSPFDFSKADEMGIYRCEHQQRKLEEYVQKRGYLEGKYMVQAFSLLRANDLIWSSYVNNYLLGREPFQFDMLYWNCDALRMPAKMHMTYLRDVVVENRFMTPGEMLIDDVPVDFAKITTPLFVMAAQQDHIAPWQSVYPITQMAKSSSKKFVLSTSGHVASVINPPSRQKYHYWTSDKLPSEATDWLKDATKNDGSWWNEWRQWLDDYTDGTIPALSISQDRILEDAPGSYALTVAD